MTDEEVCEREQKSLREGPPALVTVVGNSLELSLETKLQKIFFNYMAPQTSPQENDHFVSTSVQINCCECLISETNFKGQQHYKLCPQASLQVRRESQYSDWLVRSLNRD